MNARPLLAIGAVVLLAAGAGAGYWWAHRSMMSMGAEAAVDPGKKVLYWHDPMYPQHKFDKPGKSPFMDMQLVPVYADAGGGDAAGVKVSPQLTQNLGVRTAVAESGRLSRSIEAVGAIAFDERAVELVTARTAGYVEALLVRAPLDPVRKGQPLARLFVPDWAGAQQEYLALKASPAPGAQELARAARNRLALAGMSEAQVAAVDREGKPVSHVTLVSPLDGVVGELGAREGMQVSPGALLFRINGLSTVWVNLDVPEVQAASIRPGSSVVATVPAYPGEEFKGRLAAVLPEVNATTRTLRARVELSNPQGRLKPGMFATVRLEEPGRDAVVVPSEAVIVTGERSVVVVDRGEGRFEPVDVEIGREDSGKTEILKGIEAGTRVVASGQFLLDSEASLRGLERRLAPPQAAATHRAEGRLEKVGKDDLTISHGPVPSIRWGAMTMDFAAPKAMPPELKAGDPIVFDFVESPPGTYQVTKIERKAGAGP
jgi:membrane fusion protein, copper/silver efflux system